MNLYQAYGECLESETNLDSFLCRSSQTEPTLFLRDSDHQVDLELFNEVFAFEVHGRVVHGYCDQAPENMRNATSWVVIVNGVCQFSWQDGESVIHRSRTMANGSGRSMFWLLHIILPFFLARNRSRLILHASAIQFGSEALAFTAESGVGKSSLAAGFLAKGHALISDDKLAVSRVGDRAVVFPSHPHNRPYRSTENLGDKVTSFLEDGIRLRSLLILNKSPGNDIRMTPIHGAERFQAALPSLLYHDYLDAGRSLQRLGETLDQIQLFRLEMPDDKDAIPRICDYILENERAALAPH